LDKGTTLPSLVKKDLITMSYPKSKEEQKCIVTQLNDLQTQTKKLETIAKEIFDFFIIIYAEIIRYSYRLYIFFKCFSEKSNAKTIKISAGKLIVLACAFGMDMQIPLSPL
jgi:hypothetical protein